MRKTWTVLALSLLSAAVGAGVGVRVGVGSHRSIEPDDPAAVDRMDPYSLNMADVQRVLGLTHWIADLPEGSTEWYLEWAMNGLQTAGDPIAWVTVPSDDDIQSNPWPLPDRVKEGDAIKIVSREVEEGTLGFWISPCNEIEHSGATPPPGMTFSFEIQDAGPTWLSTLYQFSEAGFPGVRWLSIDGRRTGVLLATHFPGDRPNAVSGFDGPALLLRFR